MSSRRKITITPDDKIIVIRGYKVAEVAKAAGLRPTYSASAGGWMLDATRLPDLVSWLEYRNFRYEIQAASTKCGTSESADVPFEDIADVELDLFGQVVA